MNISRLIKCIKSYKLYLVLAVVIGIFLRIYGLGIQSFWFDELCTIAFISYKSIQATLAYILLLDVHPPIYLLLMKVISKIFGISEISMRLPSAIAGIMSIFFMYFMTRKIFNKSIAASATIMLALSGSAIYYSQEARSYSILLLFSIISTLLWLDMLKKIEKENYEKKELLLYGLIGLITSYLHYFGTALIFFQLVYLLFTCFWFKKRIKGLFITGLIVAFIFNIWFLPHFICHINSLGDHSSIPRPGMQFFWDFTDFLFNKYLIGLFFLPLLFNTKKLWKSFKINIKNLKPNNPLISLCYLFLSPIIIFYILSQHTPMLVPRYLIIILPVLFLIIPMLLSKIPYLKNTRVIIYIFIVSLFGLIVFLFINPEYRSYYSLHKQDWRGTAKYIYGRLNNNSVIVFNKYPALYKYYFIKLNKNKVDLKFSSIQFPQMPMSEILEKSDKVFFVMEEEFDLQNACRKYNEIHFSGGIIVYECIIKN